MNPTVYIETSIISFLTAREPKDPLLIGQINETKKWWNSFRHRYDLLISRLVINEASFGDPEPAARRLAILKDLPELTIPESAIELSSQLLNAAALPPKAQADSLHVSICAVHGIQYLLTWNCRHLANVTLRPKIEQVCRNHGYEPPLMCTPLELTEVQP